MQKIDIFNTAESGKELDKLSLEDLLKSKGAGESAMATFATGTKVLLGMSLEKL